MSNSYRYFGQNGNGEEILLITQMISNINASEDDTAIAYNQQQNNLSKY